MSKPVQTTVAFEKYDIVKDYVGWLEMSLKDFVNMLVSREIKNNAPEEFVIRYFKL